MKKNIGIGWMVSMLVMGGGITGWEGIAMAGQEDKAMLTLSLDLPETRVESGGLVRVQVHIRNLTDQFIVLNHLDVRGVQPEYHDDFKQTNNPYKLNVLAPARDQWMDFKVYLPVGVHLVSVELNYFPPSILFLKTHLKEFTGQFMSKMGTPSRPGAKLLTLTKTERIPLYVTNAHEDQHRLIKKQSISFSCRVQPDPRMAKARGDFKIDDYRTRLENFGPVLRTGQDTLVYKQAKWRSIGNVKLEVLDVWNDRAPNFSVYLVEKSPRLLKNFGSRIVKADVTHLPQRVSWHQSLDFLELNQDDLERFFGCVIADQLQLVVDTDNEVVAARVPKDLPAAKNQPAPRPPN